MPPSQRSARLSTGSVVSGHAEHVAQAAAIDNDMQRQERDWIAGLRAQGIKAAHPDDGWVGRDCDRIHLCYPQFNDGLAVGDLLALGWPWRETRIVRIVETSGNVFAVDHAGPWYFHFEAVAS